MGNSCWRHEEEKFFDSAAARPLYVPKLFFGPAHVRRGAMAGVRICRKCLRFVAVHCLHLCACIYLGLPAGLPPFNFRTAFLSLCTWAETQRSAGGPVELESDGGGESDAELQVCSLHNFIFHALTLSTCMHV